MYNLTVQALSLADLIFSLKRKPHEIEIIIVMTYIFHYIYEKTGAWRYILLFTESHLMMGGQEKGERGRKKGKRRKRRRRRGERRKRRERRREGKGKGREMRD